MANPKFCVGVLSEATYTATSTNSSFPLSNLSTYVPTDLWKANDSSAPQYLNIDFGSAVSRNFALFAGHNLNSMPTVLLQAADDAAYTTNLVDVVADIKTSADPALFTFNAVTKRYWRIKYSNTAGNVPQMGQIFINTIFTTAFGPDLPTRISNESFETQEHTTLSGLIRTASTYGGRIVHELSWSNVDSTFAAGIQRVFQKTAGRRFPFYYWDHNGVAWFVHFVDDYTPAELFRAGIYNVRMKLKTQGVNQNPLA